MLFNSLSRDWITSLALSTIQLVHNLCTPAVLWAVDFYCFVNVCDQGMYGVTMQPSGISIWLKSCECEGLIYGPILWMGMIPPRRGYADRASSRQIWRAECREQSEKCFPKRFIISNAKSRWGAYFTGVDLVYEALRGADQYVRVSTAFLITLHPGAISECFFNFLLKYKCVSTLYTTHSSLLFVFVCLFSFNEFYSFVYRV